MSIRLVKRIVRSLAARISPAPASSTGIRAIAGPPAQELSTGWQDSSIPEKQRQAFAGVLRDLREGRIRDDFKALDAAMRAIDIANPLVIEIGAGGGWNAEVLTRLMKSPFRYVGMDYSESMMHLARSEYPAQRFVVGDATQLPFADASCDVLIFGTVLMHLMNYSHAIAEGRRVAAKWCIFHTVPVLKNGATRSFEKLAYGIPVVEIVFNEAELMNLIKNCGFELKQTFESLPHPYLKQAVAEDVRVRTYLCRTC